MSQQVQGQQGQQEPRSERPPANSVTDVEARQAGRSHGTLATEWEMLPDLGAGTASDASRQGDPGLSLTAEEGGNASGSGWAIELQETYYLVRSVLVPPLARRTLAPSTGETERLAPRLGLRPVALTLLGCLLLLLVVGALDGMQQYARIHMQAGDALSHLRAAQALLDARQPGQPLTITTLAEIDSQLNAAQSDFADLQSELGDPSGVVQLGTVIPRLSSRIARAADLARAGDDACKGLSELVAAANDLLVLRADGFIDARGQLTRAGRLSPVAAALLLHLRDALASAAGPLDVAAHGIWPEDLAVLPPTLASSADLAALSGVLASWPQTRAELLAPNGWRLLLPLALGAPSVNTSVNNQ